mmetsp:Transcript_19297/g.54530  ORF Transcript_19297/g.54530 Transcript_19297/m.54530 type:complete len:276 (-) Transcript_19297:484-1311(-)
MSARLDEAVGPAAVHDVELDDAQLLHHVHDGLEVLPLVGEGLRIVPADGEEAEDGVAVVLRGADVRADHVGDVVGRRVVRLQGVDEGHAAQLEVGAAHVVSGVLVVRHVARDVRVGVLVAADVEELLERVVRHRRVLRYVYLHRAARDAAGAVVLVVAVLGYDGGLVHGARAPRINLGLPPAQWLLRGGFLHQLRRPHQLRHPGLHRLPPVPAAVHDVHSHAREHAVEDVLQGLVVLPEVREGARDVAHGECPHLRRRQTLVPDGEPEHVDVVPP